jgi:hypothetical protein
MGEMALLSRILADPVFEGLTSPFNLAAKPRQVHRLWRCDVKNQGNTGIQNQRRNSATKQSSL